MKHTLPIILIACCAAANANAQTAKEKECMRVTDFAEKVHKARQQGMPQAAVLSVLQDQGIYSGPMVWATKAVYRADADTPTWMLTGSLWGECLKRGGELS